MENQQQTENVSVEIERPIAELTATELGERLVDAELTKREAEAYSAELKRELLKRIERGEVVSVAHPVIQVDGKPVQPVGMVEIRHKSRSGLKYDEAQIVRLLKDQIAEPAYVTLEVIEREVLDRKAFEQDLYELPTLANLQKYVKQQESDWIEVRGLPK